MKKKVLVILALLLMLGAASVFAWPGGNWLYALPGSDFKIKFWVQGNIDLIADGKTHNNAGSYRASGERVTITFRNREELGNLSGKTFVLRILSNNDLDGGDGTWVRID
ncbi:MAG: hypothetical protein LBH35_07680 [Treponema sp.]|jgi:hypothetical protein|nr:hypothetical protein [Treponema sp.]